MICACSFGVCVAVCGGVWVYDVFRVCVCVNVLFFCVRVLWVWSEYL